MGEQLENPLSNGDFKTATLHEGQECFDFNLLRLDSFNSNPLNTTYGGATTIPSNKRRSPDSSNLVTDPIKKPKKLFQDNPQDTNNNASSSYYYNGFSKIPLPVLSRPEDPTRMPTATLTQSVHSVASLRRCVSDPSEGCGVNLAPLSPPENAKNVSGDVVVTPASKGSASLPPRPPTIRRSASDPSPSKSFSRSSSSIDMGVDGSPNYENLRKLKSYMKEMNQWMDELLPDQVMCEDDEQYKDADDKSVKCDSVGDVEEAVSVERVGDCLIIHFRCPCGRGYQILLSGNSCYYKLM